MFIITICNGCFIRRLICFCLIFVVGVSTVNNFDDIQIKIYW